MICSRWRSSAVSLAMSLKRIYKVITNEDLLKEISEQRIKRLSDLNANGILNQNVIDDALNDSISFCESFIILPKQSNTTS